MPWVNLDDEFPEHDKVDALSDAAFRLHVAGICYCNRRLTDGFIRTAKVPRLVPRFRRVTLDELLEAGMWIDHGGRFEIHDYLDWNRSRAEVEAERERKSKAGKKGAQSRWG